MPQQSLKELREQAKARREASKTPAASVSTTRRATEPTVPNEMPPIPASDVSSTTRQNAVEYGTRIVSLRNYMADRRETTAYSSAQSDAQSNRSRGTGVTDHEIITALDTTRKELQRVAAENADIKQQLIEIKELLKSTRR